MLSVRPPSPSATFTCTDVLPSEVVDEHGHTVGPHQVVGVSGQRVVLPVFGIGCSETKKKVVEEENLVFPYKVPDCCRGDST